MAGSQISEKAARSPSRLKYWLAAVIAVLGIAGLFTSGVRARLEAQTAVKRETAQIAVTPVSIVRPQHLSPKQDIVLPGNVQPYYNSPVYARTNGYVKRWYVDIGAHVKQGQLLADIETPEVDQQLQQARANMATAQANLDLSQITAARYERLKSTNAVARQDVDNASGTNSANAAIVHADQANVRQLEALQSFEKVYAPYDGVITFRNTDIGDLINSGNTGPTTQLFQIVQPERLRVYVNVPEPYAKQVKTGISADLELAESPGRYFHGKLVRTAQAIDYSTRTLLVEIDADNRTGEIFNGAYAQVHFKLPTASSTFVLPVNCLLFRSEGLQVAIVNEGCVELRTIKPGHDFGDRIEVVSGLNGSEEVVINPPDSIVARQAVRVGQPSVIGGPQ
ncbi:MAG TPA: efflux RND transporter periplasmic adaptor subunit [Bryobacteraceae bacterium]|jgi:RND family efflux transporter MFP subunit|nr:efflux RND transporter periplasmic adaptor subunit [Bryobacteraceae bacterium]